MTTGKDIDQTPKGRGWRERAAQTYDRATLSPSASTARASGPWRQVRRIGSAWASKARRVRVAISSATSALSLNREIQLRTVSRAYHPRSREAPRHHESATVRTGEFTGGEFALERRIARQQDNQARFLASRVVVR
jgi:hypothetical protein